MASSALRGHHPVIGALLQIARARLFDAPATKTSMYGKLICVVNSHSTADSVVPPISQYFVPLCPHCNETGEFWKRSHRNRMVGF